MTRRQKMGCAVLLMTSLLGFVLGEVTLRIVSPGPKFTPDEECGWVPTPGYEQGVEVHSSQGLRDVERELEKPAGTRRIVVVGDSFTYGAGVTLEESYTKVLEGLLADDVQVVNGGVPGYSNAQADAWLKKYGMDWEPDLVIVGVFLGNDLWENVGSATHVVVDGALVEKPKREKKERSWFRKTRNRSKFYRLLKKLPERVLDALDDEKHLTMYWAHTHSRMGVCIKGPAAASWEPGWTILADSLKAIRDRVAPRPVVILVIPDEFQINPEVREEVVRRHEIDPDQYDWLAPNRRLAAICKDLGVVVVDTTPLLEERIRTGEPMYIPPLDAHWNADGHRLAADALAKSTPLQVYRSE